MELQLEAGEGEVVPVGSNASPRAMIVPQDSLRLRAIRRNSGAVDSTRRPSGSRQSSRTAVVPRYVVVESAGDASNVRSGAAVRP